MEGTSTHVNARPRFEMGYWGYTFPLATLSFVTIDYYQHGGSDLLQAMSYLSVMLVTFVVAMCAIHTLLLLQKRWDIFVPNHKWSPLSFMKVIHFSLRGAAKKLERFVTSLLCPLECTNTPSLNISRSTAQLWAIPERR